jgi:hypothetical protein
MLTRAREQRIDADHDIGRLTRERTDSTTCREKTSMRRGR